MWLEFRNFTRILAKPRNAAGIVILCSLIPAEAFACACGCSVFDVGSRSLMPKEGDHGGAVFFEWYRANQNQNWRGLSKAPAADNEDKRVLTDWYVVGLQYMFNRDWGMQVRMPYATRSFTTGDDYSTYHASHLGDVEITGLYTGFAKDMSTGVIFGLKLPTGSYTTANFDRDTQIGSGSTDFILGAFHRGIITGDNAWQYFGQVKWMQAFATKSTEEGDFGPGTSLDGAVGITYNNWYHVGPFDKIAPVLQIIGSHRQPDSGAASLPDETGHDRLFISPGIEFTKVLSEEENKTLKLYGDVEIPIYQRTNGNQLVTPVMFKFTGAVTF